jgi:hypothetical protein
MVSHGYDASKPGQGLNTLLCFYFLKGNISVFLVVLVVLGLQLQLYVRWYCTHCLSLALSLSLCLSCCSQLQHRASVKRFVSLRCLNPKTIGRISPSQGRYLHTEQKQTSMPQVGVEPAIPVFERAKTFHALDRVLLLFTNIHV